MDKISATLTSFCHGFVDAQFIMCGSIANKPSICGGDAMFLLQNRLWGIIWLDWKGVHFLETSGEALQTHQMKEKRRMH